MKRLLILLVSLASLVPGALAQNADMIRPISRADLGGYARLLEMSDEQVQVVEMLHEGYMQALQRANAAMREAMEEVTRAWNPESGEMLDPDAALKAQETMATASMDNLRANLDLQDQLFEDMRALLEPSQIEVFPRVERMRRRQMLLQEMQIAWSQVDLVDCLDTLEMSSDVSPDFDEGVIRYEIAMDRELSKLFDFMLEMIERGPEMMMNPDEAEMMEMMESFFGWMRAMRGVNKQHARKLGAMMSEPDRERFDDQTRRVAFPTVYRDSDTTRALDVAAGLADLTADQPEGIRAIRTQYARELGTANAVWAAAIDEEAEDIDFQSMIMSFMGNQDTNSAKAEKAREELDLKFRERLESLLTPEQIERLPEARKTQRQLFEEQMQEQEQLIRDLQEAGIDDGGK